MSTHILDVSGARPLTSTTNDPARTVASVPAKAGDDVAATLSAFRELRFELPENARFQRRRYVRKEIVRENGKPKPNPVEAERAANPYETVDVEEVRLVVVVTSLSLFGRTSHLPTDAGEEAPSYESTPHTFITAKRWGDDPHLLESGELVEEKTLAEFLGQAEV